MAEMMLMDIPGETNEQKAEYIRDKFDPLITEQIMLFISELRMKARARVIARAETFHQ
jgi:hypothetical protein